MTEKGKVAVMGVAVMGKNYFTDGFLLAGVHDTFTTDEQNEEEVLNKLLDEKQYALIFVTEGTFKRLSWRTKQRIESITYPLVVPLPSLRGPDEEEQDLRMMVKRALGFDLMKKEMNDNKG